MARINDIAEAAGVSVATVSRYLNGRPYVSAALAASIAEAIDELGYHPNQNARTLRSGRTDRIAVLVNRLSHPFYAKLVEGIAEEAHVAGVDLLIHQSGTDGWSLDRIARQARERAVDGMIIGTGREEQSFATLIGKVPMVSCDQALNAPGCPRIFIDHYASTIAGLEHIAERGSSQILAIYGSERDHVCSSDSHRQRAFKAFAGREGSPRLLPLAVRDVGIGDDSLLAGARLLAHILKEAPEVDAVFAGSDEIASGLVTAARRSGIYVPGRLRILGFDDQPIAEALDISTVRQPIKEMGAKAMSVLVAQINGRKADTEDHELEFSIVQRATT